MSQECDVYMEEISDCLDQKKSLSPDLDSHLESCQECRDFSQMWSRDKASLATIASVPDQTNPPSGIADSVLKARTRSRKTRKTRTLGVWGSVAAALSLTTGIIAWNQQSEPNVVSHQPPPPEVADLPDGTGNPTFRISEIDTRPLEIKVREFTELGSQALKQKGQTYANAVKGIRYLAVNFSE